VNKYEFQFVWDFKKSDCFLKLCLFSVNIRNCLSVDMPLYSDSLVHGCMNVWLNSYVRILLLFVFLIYDFFGGVDFDWFYVRVAKYKVIRMFPYLCIKNIHFHALIKKYFSFLKHSYICFLVFSEHKYCILCFLPQ